MDRKIFDVTRNQNILVIIFVIGLKQFLRSIGIDFCGGNHQLISCTFSMSFLQAALQTASGRLSSPIRGYFWDSFFTLREIQMANDKLHLLLHECFDSMTPAQTPLMPTKRKWNDLVHFKTDKPLRKVLVARVLSSVLRFHRPLKQLETILDFHCEHPRLRIPNQTNPQTSTGKSNEITGHPHRALPLSYLAYHLR